MYRSFHSLASFYKKKELHTKKLNQIIANNKDQLHFNKGLNLINHYLSDKKPFHIIIDKSILEKILSNLVESYTEEEIYNLYECFVIQEKIHFIDNEIKKVKKLVKTDCDCIIHIPLIDEDGVNLICPICLNEIKKAIDIDTFNIDTPFYYSDLKIPLSKNEALHLLANYSGVDINTINTIISFNDNLLQSKKLVLVNKK